MDLYQQPADKKRNPYFFCYINKNDRYHISVLKVFSKKNWNKAGI